MKKNKASEYVMKKYNITSNLFINFLLLIKQFFYFFAYIIFFTFLIVTTTNAAFDAGETISRHLTPLNFLEQHRDLPVEYLYVIYMADIDLQHEFSKEKSHPLFSVLKAKKKLPLARKSILPSVTYTDLNDLMTPLEGAEYINNRRMFPLLQIPLFSWLLKEYGPCYYQDKSGTTSLVTITINGMLYDIQRRAKNDPVAKLVLAFLNHPYTKSIRLKSTDYQSWFIRYSPYLSWLFTPEQTEPTFSEKLTLLIDSPYTEEQIRNNRLIDLSKKGYKYKKDYNFISHEINENGKEKFVSSDEIILPETKSQKLLDDDYPVLSKPGDKLVLKTGLKVATLLTAGLSLFPAASAYNTPAPPPPQCNIQSKCLGGAHLLNNVNIAWRLLGFSSGCFELTENITLNQQYNLPFFKDCNNPFSGELKTGPYSIQTGNSISPIFGCINQTTITGNINLCAHNSALTSPVIAEQALHENILTIQQTGNCETQYPLLGNITGDYNQIIFTGTSGKVSTGSGTGIIASHVSGSHNSIRIQNSELYNTSITTVAGGNNNTYHQQDLNITKFTDHKLPDNKLLAANFFTGDKTTIVQQNIDARLIVSPPYSPHQNIQKNQNSAVNIFSADTFTQIDLAPETVRITNA
ncbi:MAG: hypothetical protein OXC48_08720, partial [Endozoicomonadaceae bacterium]|nr:hypothetical protein [Endozoicomonadaceae bacterium]